MYMMPVVHWYSKQCKHRSNVDKPIRWPKAGNSNHMYKYACDQTPVHLMYTAGEWSGKSMDMYVSAIYQVISFINMYHYLVQCVVLMFIVLLARMVVILSWNCTRHTHVKIYYVCLFSCCYAGQVSPRYDIIFSVIWYVLLLCSFHNLLVCLWLSPKFCLDFFLMSGLL